MAYTSPVFWTFFLLTALTLFIFRRRGGDAPAFRVPLYPVIPLAFCAACVYMLYSSINYVRFASDDHVLVSADCDNRLVLRPRTADGSYARPLIGIEVDAP